MLQKENSILGYVHAIMIFTHQIEGLFIVALTHSGEHFIYLQICYFITQVLYNK